MRTSSGWILALVLAVPLAWAGCDSSNGDKDTTVADTPDAADAPGEVAGDVVEDAPQPDVPPQDVPAEVPEDVPTEVAGDLVEGDPMPDVAWDTLPRLPAGKTFTTDFAAGVAQADISPTQPTHLGGFGFCMGDENLCRSTDGVHDALLASAVAIADPATGEVVIFVGVDTIGLIRADVEELHRRIQRALYETYGVFLPGERAILSASHAHSACDTVGLWGPLFGAGRQQQYLDILMDGVVKAAVDAYGNLQDVTMDWGKGTYENNDDDPDADDEDLFIVRGKKGDGSALFTLVRYNAHPTTYGSEMFAASADWIGTMRKKLETEVGGLNVLVAGPMGSVYPARPESCGLAEEAFPEGDRTDNPDMNPNDYMKVTCTGFSIADVAMTALQSAVPVAATGGVTFKHTEFEFHPTNGTLMMLAEIGPLPYDWVDVDDPEAMMHSIFSVATVGDLTWITTPGESFPAFGKEAAGIAVEAGLPNPIVLGLAQDWMGYLLLKSRWLIDEADRLQPLSYHRGLSPGPGVEPAYMAALRALLGLPAAK